GGHLPGAPAGRPGRGLAVSLGEIARQIIITVKGHNPDQRIDFVHQVLGPYSPTLLTEWTYQIETVPSLVHVYQLTASAPQSTLHELSKIPGVEAERNLVLGRAATPNDALYQDSWLFFKPQWALSTMSAEKAWDCVFLNAPGAPVIVAIIDSGITPGHSDLAAHVNPNGRRFRGSVVDNVVDDQDGHGTFLAGTIGAITNNRTGVASATWPIHVSLLP